MVKFNVSIFVEIYMVKFNVSIFKIMGFFVNAKYVHKHVILNKTNQTFHYFDKMFFFYLNPTSYPNQNVNISFHYIFFYKTSILLKHN